MKIHKYGTVILTEGPVKVDGWNIERESDDPAYATDEQLLLKFAITWAQKKLNAAILNDLQRAAKTRKREPSQDELQQAGHVQYYGQAGTNPNPCTCIFCRSENQKLLETSLPKITSGLPPTCLKHSEQMVLGFYERPGGPPGNNWVCRSCAKGRSEIN
jgi:hypothetical protein